MSDDPTTAGELLEQRVARHLANVYPETDTAALARQLVETMTLTNVDAPPAAANKWDQRDVLTITYGNSLMRPDQVPLETLHAFLDRYLSSVVSAVHVLPFFPYSSDDGFAVLNYLQVNDALGDWDNIEAIGKDYRLMVDLVINHGSSRSQWFENFKQGIDPGRDYFYTTDIDADISEVVRPRPDPLLQRVVTVDGDKLVWCTFGHDQVDFDFSNPAVLVEFANILSRYLDAGARILRLDAVAFLWKEPGTPCIHRQQTHELVKLLRVLAEAKAPRAVIITETNVPNRDNLTYFGNADEAHAIYNFSLPPLLIHALLSGDCRHLKTWMMSMPPAQTGTCYLNFIASHDGIGLRPAEGLLSAAELNELLDTLTRFGGRISMREDSGGKLRPYEANISLWSALAGTVDTGHDDLQFERFICAHTIMIALEGIPAIYLHSFFGTPNDTERVERSGRYRSINRHIFDADALEAELADTGSRPHRVYSELTRLLAIRIRQPAFHPNAVQFTMHLGLSVFAFWRQSMDRRQSIFCVSNVTNVQQLIDMADINLIGTDTWVDLISGKRIEHTDSKIMLRPYQTLWLSNRDGDGPVGAP